MRIGIKTFAAAAAVIMAAALAGCSDHHEPPPLERLELVSRFFDSVRKHDFETAARQGQTLYEMDRNNEFLLHLITIHESNTYLANAQKELNSGDADAALRELNAGLAKYPENSTLNKYRNKIAELRNIKNRIAEMEHAKGEARMRKALSDAKKDADKTLGTKIPPKLKKYFADYEKKIQKAASEEENKRRRLEAEKERKRWEAYFHDCMSKIRNVMLEAEKSDGGVPEPRAKRLPSQLVRKNFRDQAPPGGKKPESLDRPPPIVAPETESTP